MAEAEGLWWAAMLLARKVDEAREQERDGVVVPVDPAKALPRWVRALAAWRRWSLGGA